MTANPRQPTPSEPPSSVGFLVLSWLFVFLPLAWGVWQTLLKAYALFH